VHRLVERLPRDSEGAGRPGDDAAVIGQYLLEQGTLGGEAIRF